jgi:hypothetical protein
MNSEISAHYRLTGVRLPCYGSAMNDLKLLPIPVSPNDDYRAGSDGKIYSRTRYAGFGRKHYVDWYALTGSPSSKGYYLVSLCHNNKKVTASVHRLVCMAFHGMPASRTMQVRHLNGIRTDNRPENLAWGTQAENWQDRKNHGNGISGERHPMSKLTDEERAHIRWAVAKGICSRRAVAIALGMSDSAISMVCRDQQ